MARTSCNPRNAFKERQLAEKAVNKLIEELPPMEKYCNFCGEYHIIEEIQVGEQIIKTCPLVPVHKFSFSRK